MLRSSFFDLLVGIDLDVVGGWWCFNARNGKALLILKIELFNVLARLFKLIGLDWERSSLLIVLDILVVMVY